MKAVEAVGTILPIALIIGGKVSLTILSNILSNSTFSGITFIAGRLEGICIVGRFIWYCTRTGRQYINM